MPNPIPVNPPLPPAFYRTRNESRPKEELDSWWDRPYAVTDARGNFRVYCLNGGAWDRPTFLGLAPTYEDACALADQVQTRWVRERAMPVAYYPADQSHLVELVRLPQRPDAAATVLGRFETIAAAAAWKHAHFPAVP